MSGRRLRRDYITPARRTDGTRRLRAAQAWCSAFGDGHLAEQGPVVLRDREVDDPRCVSQVRRQRLLRLLEVVGLDVRRPGVAVAEGLDQDVLLRVVQAAGPVEPQAARLAPGRLGELGGDLRPLVGVFWPDLELGRDKDHQSSLLTGDGGGPHRYPVSGTPGAR